MRAAARATLYGKISKGEQQPPALGGRNSPRRYDKVWIYFNIDPASSARTDKTATGGRRPAGPRSGGRREGMNPLALPVYHMKGMNSNDI